MTKYEPLFEMAIPHTFLDAEVSVKEKAKLIISNKLQQASYWDETPSNVEGMTKEEIKAVNLELNRLIDKIELKFGIQNIHDRAKKRVGK
jgi:hypothetical protein